MHPPVFVQFNFFRQMVVLLNMRCTHRPFNDYHPMVQFPAISSISLPLFSCRRDTLQNAVATSATQGREPSTSRQWWRTKTTEAGTAILPSATETIWRSQRGELRGEFPATICQQQQQQWQHEQISGSSQFRSRRWWWR